MIFFIDVVLKINLAVIRISKMMKTDTLFVVFLEILVKKRLVLAITCTVEYIAVMDADLTSTELLPGNVVFIEKKRIDCVGRGGLRPKWRHVRFFFANNFIN